MTRPADPYAARCRELAAAPAYTPYAAAFLGAARSTECGGVAGPIALLSALVEAGVDAADAGAELLAVAEWEVSADPGGLDPRWLPPVAPALAPETQETPCL